MSASSKTSAIDLIILGLLHNEPMSPYDLSKLQGMYELVKISKPAIYKNVHRLEQKGFLKSSVTKTGNMPEKKIYTITENGKEHLLALMEQCVAGPIRFHFDFNAFILMIMVQPKENALSLLSDLRHKLKENLTYLEKSRSRFSYLPFPIGSLASQHIRLNKTLITWLQDFEVEFEKVQT